MSFLPLAVLGALGVAAIASRGRSSGLASAPSSSSSSTSRAVCTYSADEMPLASDVRVRLWARCAGRTSGEVEALIARGAAEGKGEAWATATRRAYQQAQALANRAPEPVSPATRREVEGHMSLTETAARGRALGALPETLNRKAEGAGAAAAAAGQRARAAQQTPARPSTQGAARGRFMEAQQRELATVAGTEGSQTETTGSQQRDPVLARALASQTARAVRLRLPGWENNVAMFRTAAGLRAGTTYDQAVREALRGYGIRNAPEEIST